MRRCIVKTPIYLLTESDCLHQTVGSRRLNLAFSVHICLKTHYRPTTSKCRMLMIWIWIRTLAADIWNASENVLNLNLNISWQLSDHNIKCLTLADDFSSASANVLIIDSPVLWECVNSLIRQPLFTISTALFKDCFVTVLADHKEQKT